MSKDESFKTVRGGGELLVSVLAAVALSSAYASTFNVPSGTTDTKTGLNETNRTIKPGGHDDNHSLNDWYREKP